MMSRKTLEWYRLGRGGGGTPWKITELLYTFHHFTHAICPQPQNVFSCSSVSIFVMEFWHAICCNSKRYSHRQFLLCVFSQMQGSYAYQTWVKVPKKYSKCPLPPEYSLHTHDTTSRWYIHNGIVCNKYLLYYKGYIMVISNLSNELQQLSTL